jgi:ribonuclease VapC
MRRHWEFDASAGVELLNAERAVMEFLSAARIKVEPVHPTAAHLALEAFDRYGKGNQHPAQLNLGDCFAYAQAKLSGAALLFKRQDFSKTDIESAS